MSITLSFLSELIWSVLDAFKVAISADTVEMVSQAITIVIQNTATDSCLQQFSILDTLNFIENVGALV